MGVLLGLHRIEAEVGQEAEAVGTEATSHLHGYLPYSAHIAPKLFLGHVGLGDGQKHHRHPTQPVAEHHYFLVLVEDLCHFSLGHYLAEDAVGHILPWPHINS